MSWPSSAAAIWSPSTPLRLLLFLDVEATARTAGGTTLEEIHRYFVGEQERRRCLLEKTTIPHLVLDVEADPETNLARATDFWLIERRRAYGSSATTQDSRPRPLASR